MKVTVLASGSKGNSTLIESANTKILIDVGISYKILVEKLRAVNVGIDEIDAIFITHEHVDHIKGLETLTKKKNIPIISSPGTYRGIVGSHSIGVMYNEFNTIEADELAEVNELTVIPFSVSHDANEPFGYIVTEGDKKLVYLTDSGYISQVNEEKIKDADIYIMETNHNIEMLMCTERPWTLKQRILGDTGHMNNEDALNTLTRVVTGRTKVIYLAHISEEANNVDLLMVTVKEIFSQSEHNGHIKFIVAKQYEMSEVSEV